MHIYMQDAFCRQYHLHEFNNMPYFLQGCTASVLTISLVTPDNIVLLNTSRQWNENRQTLTVKVT